MPAPPSRPLYALALALPGLLLSAVGTVILVGALTGFLWLFVFGDQSWPSWVSTVTATAAAAAFLAGCAGSTMAAVRLSRRETTAAQRRRHVALAATFLGGGIALVLVQQWSVGNVGRRPSAESACEAFCRSRGVAIASVSPRRDPVRECACLDGRGREVARIKIDQLLRKGPTP